MPTTSETIWAEPAQSYMLPLSMTNYPQSLTILKLNNMPIFNVFRINYELLGKIIQLKQEVDPERKDTFRYKAIQSTYPKTNQYGKQLKLNL